MNIIERFVLRHRGRRMKAKTTTLHPDKKDTLALADSDLDDEDMRKAAIVTRQHNNPVVQDMGFRIVIDKGGNKRVI